MASRSKNQSGMIQTNDNWSAATAQAIANRLIRKDFISQPKLYKRGNNAADFVTNVENFCKAVNIDGEDKTFILLNNMDEDVKYEIFALPEYSSKHEDYEWLVETFIQLNGEKLENAPLVELLNIKQEGRSIKDFISCLRVAGFRRMGQNNPGVREKYMLLALINGLDDRNLAITVKSYKPKTVQEAHDFIQQMLNKYPGLTRNDYRTVNVVQRQPAEKFVDVASLENEIRLLKEQVKYLISLTNRLMESRQPDQVPKQFPNRPNNVSSPNPLYGSSKCYNCQKVGHISRNCRSNCGICGQSGHTSANCRNSNKRNTNRQNSFRMLNDVGFDDMNSMDCDQQSEQLEAPEEQLNVVSTTSGSGIEKNEKPESTKKWSEVVKKGPRKIVRRYELESQWADYIDGKRNKPKTPLHRNLNNQTQITGRRPELAANKPIVSCLCENVPVKLLLDSGAECNVISSELLHELRKKQPELREDNRTTRLKCANGQFMNTRGTINLTLRIGQSTSRHPFRIVDGIFPDLICGIRMMKGSNITIQPTTDCIFINNERIPFLSKTIIENCSSTQGNVTTSTARATSRC